ncbi:MAG: hypothetical protein HND48_18820 [Chloroflexi bacterium]|nr:hypothetical protein [Chloroflexota bacterium]
MPLAPQLVVYDARIVTPQTRYQPRLAWLTEVVSTVGAPVRQIVLTDAVTGEVLFTFNKIHSAPWIDPDTALSRAVCPVDRAGDRPACARQSRHGDLRRQQLANTSRHVPV